ncbi:acetylglutamate kinase [Bibersteinia trehalosi]|uniref:Acetylglutamate kinase n=1 Tax=Bibersteinia trehalosi USDA-ARS-USMARC-189 TaxID=1263831 RepID=A0ABM5PFA4_BIBTR|nr:acetylglutamate kinase [Bibersteinia trehalosi]AGH37973.1 Acetylglutamate kinase [Bibersteinia trehalosi USDA-ARS-USMARC-192]AHG84540.1 Acetylglutamate kinase [Bibersteinia trehalosi USDA-ARS-USMARC-189]
MQQSQIEALTKVMGEATPYIKKYQGKTIVVKYGGNAMINEELKQAVMQDLLLLNQIGVKVVLVHGGGPEISHGLKLIGKESQFINGLRVTDKETMDVVQQMLAGKVNKSLVALLKGKGIGLCGLDGNMLLCEKLQTEYDLGFVGEIKSVDTTLLNFALDSGFIPVIATIGADEHGTAYNINADTAASEIAIALQAEKLVSMTDIAGLLMNKDDESTLIPEVEINEVQTLIDKGIISGGMIPKIACCVDCVKAGVKESAIIDGRIPHAILLEMFSTEGNGTLFYKKEANHE